MTTHQFINRQSFNLCYCHVFGSTSGKKYCIVHTKKDFDFKEYKYWYEKVARIFWKYLKEKIIMLKDNVDCIDWLQRAIL